MSDDVKDVDTGEADKAKWGTTRTINVLKEAIAESMADNQTREQPKPQEPKESDITEAKLPLKLVVGIILFAITQVIALTGVYYDLRGDVRLLQEQESELTDSDIVELKMKIEQLERDAKRMELKLLESPTVLDNMRRVGDLNADVRELKARVRALESR
tara:strand:- start:9317 stop:9793 length:477 start_codon:yes stop_codon:yes gene_type:complete